VSRFLFTFLLFFAFIGNAIAQNGGEDSRKLGIALDYFVSGKYHEALMLLSKLDKKYELNPRFKAYIGVCYYHEWEYEKACKYLDPVIHQLDVYAPHERSIYYNSAAESHFMLQEYAKAVPYYELQLLVCHDNERAETYYRLGFCYMFEEQWQQAIDYFESSQAYFSKYLLPDKEVRTTQIAKMINGCKEKIKEEKSRSVHSNDEKQ